MIRVEPTSKQCFNYLIPLRHVLLTYVSFVYFFFKLQYIYLTTSPVYKGSVHEIAQYDPYYPL